MFRCSNKDLGNSVRAFLSCGAVCILTSSSCIKDIMEGSNFLENGKIPQERKSTCFQVAFYAFVFVLISILTLACTIFCLLHPTQTPGFCWAHGTLRGFSPQNSSYMIWDWNLEHCNGFVEKDQDQFLTIKQNGHYFIYAQVYRIEQMNESFTLQLCKEQSSKDAIILDKAVGPNKGDKIGTTNFARLFSLNKGDRLYCRGNFGLDEILTGHFSYWGLFKM